MLKCFFNRSKKEYDDLLKNFHETLNWLRIRLRKENIDTEVIKSKFEELKNTLSKMKQLNVNKRKTSFHQWELEEFERIAKRRKLQLTDRNKPS